MMLSVVLVNVHIHKGIILYPSADDAREKVTI